MTDRRFRSTWVVTAVLAWACVAAGPSPSGGPATRPSRAAAVAAATQPVKAPPPPVQSELGRQSIRRSDGTAPATRSAATPDGAASAIQQTTPALELPKVAGALAIVLGLIFALRAVMRRTFPSARMAGATTAVQLLSRTVLSPKQHVMLLRVGRRLVVIGDSGGQMSALSEITDRDEVAALVGQIRDEKLTAAGPTFGGLLGRIRNGTEAVGAPPEPAGPRPTANEPDEADDPEAASTREEINGLLAKVRLLSHQFKGT